MKKKNLIFVMIFLLILSSVLIIIKKKGITFNSESNSLKYLTEYEKSSTDECDAYYKDAEYGFVVATDSNTKNLVFLVDKCSVPLDDYIMSNTDKQWEKYFENLTEEIKGTYGSFDIFKSKLETYKELACNTKKRSLKDTNDYDLINTFNSSKCAELSGVGKINYKTCGTSDNNVDTLKFTGIPTGTKDKYDYNLSYSYSSEGSLFQDGNCNSYSIDGILELANNSGNKTKTEVCNYFSNLFDSGLLDINDINVLKGTYTGTDLVYKDVNCSEYNFDKTNNSCISKTNSGGTTYYVGLNNERVSSCEGLELNTCDAAAEIAIGTYDSRNHQMGYIANYNNGTSTYPAFVVDGCSNQWDVGDIGKKIEGGCAWLQKLVNKGFVSKEQFEKAQTSCPSISINESLGACHFENDSNGNTIYSENGVWVSESDYTKDCNSSVVYFDQNGGYGLDCNNNTSWANNDVCKQLIPKNTSTTINFPTGENLYKNISTNKFKGWSRDSTCSTDDLKTGSDTLASNNSITYYACYENNTADYGEDSDNLYKTCDQQNTVLKSRKVKTTTYTDSSKGSFNINKYCNVSCQEKFYYSYPSVFQTVKSGTYFEFMYNPEIKSDMTCELTYNYDANNTGNGNIWINDYNAALEKENDAYEVYKAYNDTLNSMKNATDSTSTSNCNCRDGFCDTKNTIEYTSYTYHSDLNRVKEEEKSKSECGGMPNLDNEIEQIENDIAKGNSTINTVVKERKELETINRECYTALDNLNELSNLKDSNSVVEVNTISDEEEKLSNTSALNNISSSDNTSQTFEVKGIETDTISDYNKNKTPKITFYYDDGVKEVNKDELTISNARLVKDTGANKSDSNTDSYTKTIGEVTINFDAYKSTNIKRQVVKYFEYSPSKVFYTDYSSTAEGLFTTSSSSKTTKLGNVYPVKLTTSGEKSVHFNLSGQLGHGNSMSELSNSKNDYTCQYNVTNDIIVQDNSDKTKYKKNFYVRSVDTTNVDPNNRKDNGTLGANWSSDKGQALMEQIEDRAKNSNTYNPNYLEYSFVLTPSSIRKIIDYNKSNKYDDFNLTCNSNGGECISKFLTNYVNGTVDENKVDIGKTMDENKLNTQRESWNYYINNAWKIKNYTNYDKKENGALNEYNNDYVETGVLP